ncbi:MAG: hypothetical protein JWO98_3115 [Frankiales bacterium]|nr:hypothetical protein [Frankiales bacterium]
MRRLHKGAVGGLLLALLGVGWGASAAAAPPPPPAVIVGTNPAVQAWFKNHEPQRTAVNDALQAAYQQLGQGPAPGPGDGCQRLVQAADAMLATVPAPKQALTPLVVAGVGQLKAGAQQCLAGNAAAARNTLTAAGNVRADADLRIDEILEQPDGSVR